MSGRMKAFLTTALPVAFSVCALSGPQLHDASQEASNLKVRVIPDKKIFVLHETVYAHVEFKNLGLKTYCFPKPSLDCTNDFPGSAVITGQPNVNDGDFEQFVCHMDRGGPPRGSLEAEIKQHWVILKPNEVYLTDKAEAKVDLNLLGEWRLETTYWQPQGAFHPVEVKKNLSSIAARVGCIVPPEPIKAEPATIQVVDIPSKH